MYGLASPPLPPEFSKNSFVYLSCVKTLIIMEKFISKTDRFCDIFLSPRAPEMRVNFEKVFIVSCQWLKNYLHTKFHLYISDKFPIYSLARTTRLAVENFWKISSAYVQWPTNIENYTYNVLIYCEVWISFLIISAPPLLSCQSVEGIFEKIFNRLWLCPKTHNRAKFHSIGLTSSMQRPRRAKLFRPGLAPEEISILAWAARLFFRHLWPGRARLKIKENKLDVTLPDSLSKKIANIYFPILSYN